MRFHRSAMIAATALGLTGCANVSDSVHDFFNPLMLSRGDIHKVRQDSQPRVVVDGWDPVLMAIGHRIKTDRGAPNWSYTVQPIMNTSGRSDGLPSDMSYLVSAAINQIAAGAIAGDLKSAKVKVVSPDAARKDFSSPLTALYGQKAETALYKTKPDMVIQGAIHSFDPEFQSIEDGADARLMFGGGNGKTDGGGNSIRRLKKSRMTVGLSMKSFANNLMIPGVQTNAVIDITESSRRSEISFFLAVVGAGASGNMSAKSDSMNKAVVDFAVADLFCRLFDYQLIDFALPGSSLYLAQAIWFESLGENEQINNMLLLLQRMRATQPASVRDRFPALPVVTSLAQLRTVATQALGLVGKAEAVDTLPASYQKLLAIHAKTMASGNNGGTTPNAAR